MIHVMQPITNAYLGAEVGAGRNTIDSPAGARETKTSTPASTKPAITPSKTYKAFFIKDSTEKNINTKDTTYTKV